MRILGISAFYHDSAAALIEDGRIAAAAQEERFTRKKHDSGFPAHAIRYCLEDSGGGSIRKRNHIGSSAGRPGRSPNPCAASFKEQRWIF